MNKTNNFLLFILLLVVITGAGYQFLQTKSQNTQTPVIPTAVVGSLEEVATNIAQMTITPGVESNGQLPTAIPWTTVLNLGQEQPLIDAIHQLYATKSMDVR